MNSALPSRWQEILRREAATNVSNVLAQAKEQPEPTRLPRWTLPALVVAVASLAMLSLLGGTEARARGSVPFDRATVLSTRTAGLGANAEDLAPRATPAPMTIPEVPEPTPSAMLAELGHNHAEERPTPPPAKARKPREKCVGCDLPRTKSKGDVQPVAVAEVAPPPVIVIPEKPAPVIVNIGTRLEAVLTDPVITGAALAPATAQLAKDLVVGDRLVMRQGTQPGRGGLRHSDRRPCPDRLQRDREGREDRAVRGLGPAAGRDGCSRQGHSQGVQGKEGRQRRPRSSGVGADLWACGSQRRALRVRLWRAWVTRRRTISWASDATGGARTRAFGSLREYPSPSTFAGTSASNEPAAGLAVRCGRGGPARARCCSSTAEQPTWPSCGRTRASSLQWLSTLAIVSYWLARRLSQALLLRSTGAKLRATHEPP